MTELNRALFLYPNLADIGPTYTPVANGGSWVGTLPLTNLQLRYLWMVARSSTAALADTRFRVDLKRDVQARGIVIPKHTGSMAARFRYLGVPSSMLFDYEAGDDIVALGGTFARSSVANYLDASGILHSAASGVPRDAHFVNALRSILLEDTRTNVALHKRDLSNASWTKSNTTAARDQVGIDGSNNTASSLTATAANGTCLQAITLASSARFQSAWVRRITGGGTINMTTDGGTTWTAITVTAGWTRVSIPTQTLANPSVGFRIVTNGDKIAIDWVQNENGTFKSSEIGSIADNTTTETRAAETLTFPFALPPQASTWYVKFVEQGTTLVSSNAGLVGVGASVNPAFTIFAAAGGFYSTLHRRSSDTSSTQAASPTIGQGVEARGVLNTDGSVQSGQSINGATETVATASAANALAGAWNDSVLTVNSRGGATIGFNAFQAVRIAPSAQTMSYAQTIVYDSGWITPFPAGKTLDDVVGMNIPALAIVPTAQAPFRYVSVQIDDAANAAGSIDISRLFVGGGFQPTFNFDVGAKIGLQSSTFRTETEGGSATYLEKPVRRTMAMTFSNGPSADSLDHGFQLGRLAGLAGQCYFVMDPSDSTRWWQTSFLAVLQQLPSFGYQTQLSIYLTHDYTIIEEL